MGPLEALHLGNGGGYFQNSCLGAWIGYGRWLRVRVRVMVRVTVRVRVTVTVMVTVTVE